MHGIFESHQGYKIIRWAGDGLFEKNAGPA
jgi:hypothetical protein